MVMRLAALFLSIVVSPIFVFSSGIEQRIGSNRHLFRDLEAAKIRVSKLEAVLEETIHKVDAKNLYLRELEKLIQDAETKIHDLQSSSYSFESGLPLVQKRISELETEVKRLWASLRTTNFELHVLEDKAKNAEEKVKAKALEVKQMKEVVTDQWIQVQHLEQMRVFNIRRHQTPSRCILIKLMSDIRGKHLTKVQEAFNIRWKGNKVSLSMQSYLKKALSQFKALWAAITKYHHQLQGFIKHEMERNEITAPLANSEVVFFVASTLITFPVFGAWILLSS
ncbi:unnamed protein product [Cochlearia groenlandica]